MKYAFKQQKHNPNKEHHVPDEWVWLRTSISDGEKETYEADQWVVLDNNDFEKYLLNKNLETNLLILNLVHDQFKTLHPSKIDFRRHLKSDVYLQKNVVMLPNGRPQKAIYSFNSQAIAEIEFVFAVNAFNFMVRRTEKLSYYKGSGEKSEQYIIADDYFDQNNPYHLREMMKERSNSRAMIFEEVKAFLNGVLAQFYLPQGKTYPEILTIAGQFWDKYSTPIDSWINVGAPQFRTMMLAESEFNFLDAPVSEGVTVRSYIINKTSY